MKILIIANFVRIPSEHGNNRFVEIANLLGEKKNEVELVTSNFYHSLKKHRELSDIDMNLSYKITLINEPGYQKNVSLKRFWSHHVFAKNVLKYLEQIDKPDIIYCAVPSLSVAKVAAKFAEKNNIRFIIDVQDLWPEAFKMVFNVPILSDLIFLPMKMTADFIYSKADDIVAVSETYLDRATTVNKKYKQKLSVYLGTDLEKFDIFHKENEVVPSDDVVRIGYIGTLGHSYDIKLVIDAIKILNNKGIKNLLFLVMGSGPLQDEFENYAKEKKVSVEFTGKLNYEEMVGRLCSCDIAVNPIKAGSAGSIINKVGDYAASALPVVNTQESREYRSLVEDFQIGFNVQNGDIQDLADKIEILYNDVDSRKRFGENNRKLAEERFDRKYTYRKIINLIEEEKNENF